MKRIVLLLFVIWAFFGIIGCTEVQENQVEKNEKTLINVKGSSTIANLSKTLAEKYMEKNPGIKIAVVGGGTSTGIRALIDGTTDIANASRKMKIEELDEAESKGLHPKEHVIALDAIAIIVSGDLPVKSLNIDQLKGIFSGKIKNWEAVGGKNLPITVISRESNSGTYLYFKEHILQDGAYRSDAEMVQSSPGVAEAVGAKNNAIGYIGIADAQHNNNVKVLPIAKDETFQPVQPNLDTVKSGEYPISRTLQVYTSDDTGKAVKGFVDFMISQEGQSIVEELGYIPLS